MQNVCVITGGGSGMGLAAAKVLGKDHSIVIAGRTLQKLEGALALLRSAGIEAEAFACDTSDRISVDNLAAHASELGRVTTVVHAAGISPHMGNAQKVIAINALGTININEAFYEIMEKGSCLINIASMAAYLAPHIVFPSGSYKYSRRDKDIFMKKMMARVNLFPEKLRSSVAYVISKHFVIWYTKAEAIRFGQKGIRVLSVSPGSFDTAMGKIEKEETDQYIQYGAIKRPGKAEEVANLIAFCASEQAGYLTGTDILCDGGVVASGARLLTQNIRHILKENSSVPA